MFWRCQRGVRGVLEMSEGFGGVGRVLELMGRFCSCWRDFGGVRGDLERLERFWKDCSSFGDVGEVSEVLTGF